MKTSDVLALAEKYGVTADVVKGVLNAILPLFGRYGPFVKTIVEMLLAARAEPQASLAPGGARAIDPDTLARLAATQEYLARALVENSLAIEALCPAEE